MNDDVLTRNDNDELAVRTVSATEGSNASSYDDVFTRDTDGKLAVRVVGNGGGGGGDVHNKGYYATPEALRTAHPTAQPGDFAIVESTDTVWVWDSDTNNWKDGDTKGQVTSVNNQTGAVVLTASDVGAATTAQGVKADTAVQPGDLATVATSGSYNDLTNKPTLGTAAAANTTDFATAAQGALAATAVQPGSLATVATTGAYGDLTGTPTIPTVGDGTITITQGGVTKGTFTTNQSGNTTIDVDAGGGSGLPDQTGQSGKFLTTDGTDASWSDKPLVNNSGQVGYGGLSILGGAGSTLCVIVGSGANSSFVGGTVVGYSARASGHDCVYGNGAQSGAQKSIAIGESAKTSAQGAVQIGCYNYTNSDANTVKIANANGNYEMMSADGTIPTARLTKVNSTITLAAAGWSSNTQTVTVNGVTSTSVVFVAPDPADTTDYVSAGILCTSQTTNSLTFTATTTPTNDIDVNIVCL